MYICRECNMESRCNSVGRIIFHSLSCLLSNCADCISQSVLCRVCSVRLLLSHSLLPSLFSLSPSTHRRRINKPSPPLQASITLVVSYGSWWLILASRTVRLSTFVLQSLCWRWLPHWRRPPTTHFWRDRYQQQRKSCPKPSVWAGSLQHKYAIHNITL